jgi:ketosteroid isomerase-like protein
MSEENLSLALGVYAAWNRGDRDWIGGHMTDDAVVRPIRGLAGFDNEYRGPGGWRKFWKAWRDAWSAVEISVERMEDMEERGVLVLLKIEGAGRDGGDELSMALSHWLKFDDGKLSEMIAMPPKTADRRRGDRT